MNWVDPYGLWALGDPLPQNVVDFSAGLGDGLLLRLGALGREKLGLNSVNICNDSYAAGSLISFFGGLGRLLYAGTAKTGAAFASSGVSASIFRNRIIIRHQLSWPI